MQNNEPIHKPLHTKDEFLTNPELTSFPWLCSPFSQSLIDNDLSLSPEERELCEKYHRDGYVVIDLGLTDEFCNELIDSLDACPGDAYFYNPQTIRYFEAWKHSRQVRELAANKKVLDTLKLLYRREAMPFQTINFITASEQDVHSDTLHFHTVHNHWLAGVWVSLEPMDEQNGTLRYVRGSHKLPITEFHKLNMSPPGYTHTAGGEEQEKYDTYEEYVMAMMEASQLPVDKFVGPAGHAVIWQANLLHGGSELLDKDRTRKSQATHYYFKDMPGDTHRYYCPMYSDERNNKYSLKDIAQKDILGLHRAVDLGWSSHNEKF